MDTHKTIPYISGDGIGPEIWDATEAVVNEAVKHCYGNDRHITWKKILAGKEAYTQTNTWLPEETIDAIKDYGMAIKGPLETPVGGGIQSLNVQLRRRLDLYACVRPITWIPGVPSPVKNPEQVNMTIFRENTEDIYTGIEWPYDSPENKRLIKFLKEDLNVTAIRFPESSGISIKPISREGTERIIDAAYHYAITHKQKRLTLVHKGNIMKYTEGHFRDWGYDYLKKTYPQSVFIWKDYEDIKKESNLDTANQALDKAEKEGLLIVDDCIADAFFQNALLIPEKYSVIVTTNLNGDYISDALAAQVGGIGISPGANINYNTGHAIFEATHGTAPSLIGLKKANPSALLLSATMMLDYMGWTEASSAITQAIKQTIDHKIVTHDFDMRHATIVGTTEYANAIISRL